MNHLILLCLGISTIIFEAASTVFTFLFAVAVTNRRLNLEGLAISAAVLNILDLTCLIFVLYQVIFTHISASAPNRSGLLIASCTTVALLTAILTLVTLLWMQFHAFLGEQTTFGGNIYRLLYAEYALWALSFIFQLAFLALCTRSPEHRGRRSATPEDLIRTLGEVQQPSPPVDMQHFTPPWSRHSTSSFSSEKQSPLLYSFQNIVRPVTSRTRLIGHASSAQTSTTSIHEPQAPQKPQAQQTLQSGASIEQAQPKQPSTRPRTPQQTTRLEPIPGSRPNSPAKVLDGPFPVYVIPEQESPTRKPARPAPPPLVNLGQLPPEMRSTSTPTTSMPDQSDVHPLFRSDSPYPPPTPTAGTTVTASALGGQYVSAQALNRTSSRSRSRPPSPAVGSASAAAGAYAFDYGIGRSRANSRTGSSSRPGSRQTSPEKLARSRSSSAMRARAMSELERPPPLPSAPVLKARASLDDQRGDGRRSGRGSPRVWFT